MNSMVLAMMDLQPSLLSSIKNSDKLIDSCEIALRAFGLLNLPVILTEQVPHKLGRTHEKVRSLISPSDLVFEKDSFSAFGSEQFVCHLKSHDFNHLVLAGVETSICIYLTAISAIKHGLNVTILSDAVSGRRECDAIDVFYDLRNRGVSIIPLETFLYSLLHSSNHSCFKDISLMIRQR
jgi:nicotinamidase-related amidase